jgi:intracellular sulfur oxidation DsrE/DsrF family protein
MILANDGGIDLLRTDKSPYVQRIQQMLVKYPNVTLVACRNGLENLRRKNVKVSLLPGTRIGRSAVDEIVSYLSKGWLYIVGRFLTLLKLFAIPIIVSAMPYYPCKLVSK